MNRTINVMNHANYLRGSSLARTTISILLGMAALSGKAFAGGDVDMGVSNLQFSPASIQAGSHPTAISFSLYSHTWSVPIIDMTYSLEVFLSPDTYHSDGNDISCGIITDPLSLNPGASTAIHLNARGLGYIAIPADTPAGPYYVMLHHECPVQNPGKQG
jgi:hypothetical protein